MAFREAKKSLESLMFELQRYESVNGLPVPAGDTASLVKGRLAFMFHILQKEVDVPDNSYGHGNKDIRGNRINKAVV